MSAHISVLRDSLHGIVGHEAWNVKVGVGSFVTMEFGRPLAPSPEGILHGEWHLWVYCCAWRIEEDGIVLAGSSDEREVMQFGVSRVNGLVVINIELENEFGDLCIEFDSGLFFRLFTVNAVHGDQWLFFAPDRQVFTVEARGQIAVEQGGE